MINQLTSHISFSISLIHSSETSSPGIAARPVMKSDEINGLNFLSKTAYQKKAYLITTERWQGPTLVE